MGAPQATGQDLIRAQSERFFRVTRSKTLPRRSTDPLCVVNLTGPLTLEVEGIRGVEWDEAQTKEAIAESVAYVQSLGWYQ